jgi:DNA-binding CsgD family transcriptional regulator
LRGRDAELALIAETLAAGRSVAISGELGIGKTALASAAAAATDRPVLSGGALASLQWWPYLPLMRAVRAELPEGRAAGAEFIAERVADGLLVVEDLHCADRDTLAILPAVLRQVATLVSYRTGELGSARAAAAVKAGAAEPVELYALAEDAAEAIVRDLDPQLDMLAIRSIIDAAGGNPMLLTEFARAGTEARPMPGPVAARLEACTEQARHAIALLGLLGRAAPPSVCGAAAAEVRASGLVVERRGRLELAHPLYGEQALELLGGAERRALHAHLATQLREPGERARHQAAAGQRTAALASALEAAKRASRLSDRARHLGLAARLARGTQRTDLRLEAAQAMLDAGEPASADRLAELDEGSAREARAKGALISARARVMLGDGDGAIRAAETGLELSRGSDREVELALDIERLAGVALCDGDPRAALKEARRVFAEARDRGRLEARAALALGMIELRSGASEWEPALCAALSAARRDAALDVELAAAHTLVVARLLAGQPDEARLLAEEMIARAVEAGLTGWELQFRASCTWVDLYARLALGEVFHACTTALARPLPSPAEEQFRAMLALGLADAAQPDEAERVLEPVLAGTPAAGGRLVDWISAEIAAFKGDAETALARATACVEHGRPAYPVAALARVTAAWATRATEAGHPQTSRRRPDFAGTRSERAAVERIDADAPRARSLFRRAARDWRRHQMRGVLRSEWAAAEAARLAGSDGRAKSELLDLEARLETLGAAALRPRVERSLRALGVARRAPRERTDGSGLSQRERQVLTLWFGGRTTRQIARQLEIADSTVEEHKDRIREKLGVRGLNESAAALIGG